MKPAINAIAKAHQRIIKTNRLFLLRKLSESEMRKAREGNPKIKYFKEKGYICGKDCKAFTFGIGVKLLRPKPLKGKVFIEGRIKFSDKGPIKGMREKAVVKLLNPRTGKEELSVIEYDNKGRLKKGYRFRGKWNEKEIEEFLLE
jgi:hypothetical protein